MVIVATWIMSTAPKRLLAQRSILFFNSPGRVLFVSPGFMMSPDFSILFTLSRSTAGGFLAPSIIQGAFPLTMKRRTSFLVSFRTVPFGNSRGKVDQRLSPFTQPVLVNLDLCLEHASRILIRKVRSPLSHSPRSFVPNATRRTALDDSSGFSTSDVEGSHSTI
jgi:hypothetical protein